MADFSLQHLVVKETQSPHHPSHCYHAWAVLCKTPMYTQGHFYHVGFSRGLWRLSFQELRAKCNPPPAPPWINIIFHCTLISHKVVWTVHLWLQWHVSASTMILDSTHPELYSTLLLLFLLAMAITSSVLFKGQ